MSTTWSWRIPSLLQGVPAALVILAVLFGLPESPRWLFSKGRVDEARRLLTIYHASGDESSDLVARELEEIEMTLQAELQIKGLSAWSILLKSAANRKRIALVVAVALLTIWNGQSVISYYFSPILDNIGVTSTTQQTGINGGMQIWNLIWAIAGAVLADRVGRRTLWLTSFFCMILANVPLTICSAIYDQHGSKPAAYLVIVFLFFYNAAFNIANNPLLYCYPTEILPFAIRAKGLSVQIAVSQAALTINQYVNPIALDNIGYYYVFYFLSRHASSRGKFSPVNSRPYRPVHH
jgi:MFS family permease